jgi:hypothetical protein
MSIDIWLLFTISLLPTFKLAEVLFLRQVVDEFRSQLFCPGSLIFTLVTVFLLFPTLLVLAILGTFWFAEAKLVPNCFDEQVSWFICMWFIVIYSWIVGYATYISYSLIDFIQRSEREREYVLLLDQYEGQEAPSLVHDSQGMTPLDISRITIGDYSSTDDNLCSICLLNFQNGERIRITSCSHKFHLPCIDQWLLKKASCPNCKKNFSDRMND